MVPEGGKTGVAAIFDHQLHGMSLTIPSSYMICGQAWFLRVTTQLNIEGLESNTDLGDNSKYRYLHIVCPCKLTEVYYYIYFSYYNHIKTVFWF